MSDVFTVKVDEAAFLNDVKDIFDPAPIIGAANQVLHLKYPDALKPPQLWDTLKTIQQLVALVCAAVEVTKQKFIQQQDPDGSKGAKFDKELALDTAVKMLDDLLVFDGWIGAIVDKLDGPFLNWIVSVYVAGKPADWLAEAKQLLGMV
jgi:hypothetical protein